MGSRDELNKRRARREAAERLQREEDAGLSNGRPFCKLFGEGEGQVLFVLREAGEAPTITLTFWIAGLGIMDSKFEYEDSDEGFAKARELFDSVDEKKAFETVAAIRRKFSLEST